MSAIRNKIFWKDIEFNQDRLTRYSINKELRNSGFFDKNDSGVTLHRLRVGEYLIRIAIVGNTRKTFRVAVFETSRRESALRLSKIDMNEDIRFKNQKWIDQNNDWKLTKTGLLDMVIYCHRLNKLRMFS